jgi:Holliday junction resolvase-like predicted endonuclease
MRRRASRVNTYTPNAGEVLVGNHLEKHGWNVYLPTRDIGVDLLAERDDRLVRVQVKESRTYDNAANPEVAWTSWTQLTHAQLEKAITMRVDLFVFSSMHPLSVAAGSGSTCCP